MHALPAPGVYWGSYPERHEPAPHSGWQPGTADCRRLVAGVRSHLPGWRQLDAAAFPDHVLLLRARLARDGLSRELLPEGLACISEAVRRTLSLDIYDSQLFAAAVMLDNRLAEMATGEGKTLAALLAAATGALAGIPVHVLTANDYLVSRDAGRLAPTYALLGLSVGAVTQETDEVARRQAYACAVTYVTARELVFDYLRDGLRLGGQRSDLARRARALDGSVDAPLLRGLCMAVIDEADSLLIDEAQMPLVLSRSEADPASRGFHWQALVLADRLDEGVDFSREPNGHPQLTESGSERLQTMSAPLGGRWLSWRMREDLVCLALAARHCYQRDHHYLVRDGKVEIIDQITGRTAPGRVWSRGLHCLIEIKEGCKPTPATRTIAQITYQRFFPRYLRLGGMSGTLTEARGELREIYGLSIVRVPLRTPCIRKTLPTRLFMDQAALWAAVAERVAAIQASGRPVLVGTGSVAESGQLSSRLRQAGIEHKVLNASLDREEALIVDQAGQAGQITVTTNMAGRGTDIALAPGVAAAGGLHVLCCQHNALRRIDRQLQGRCARQGDPGSTETWLAVNAESGQTLIRLSHLKPHQKNSEILLPQRLLRTWLAWQQDRQAASQRRARRRMLQADRAWEQGLSFRGKGE